MKEYYAQTSGCEAKTISFLGVESYDLILYLARILSNLEKRILVIDVSERGALSDGLYDSGEGLVDITEPGILTHQGIDFIPRMEEWIYRGDFYNQYLYHTNCDYDYILVDYGFHIGHTAIEKSSLVIMVSDMQKHNIQCLLPVMEQLDLPKELVIKDVVPCKIKPKDLLPDKIREIKNVIHYLDIDINDIANKIQMQHTRLITVKKCSKKMKDLLCGVVSRIEKDRTKKEIVEAISVTWRGK
ncbi:MAG: hypothetical protein PUC65_16060 [Clostridiales bacterium]|nr:hypothetical protein [Clostridiales bacterium]